MKLADFPPSGGTKVQIQWVNRSLGSNEPSDFRGVSYMSHWSLAAFERREYEQGRVWVVTRTDAPGYWVMRVSGLLPHGFHSFDAAVAAARMG